MQPRPIETLAAAANAVRRGQATCYGVHSDGRGWVGVGHLEKPSGRPVVAPAIALFLPVSSDDLLAAQRALDPATARPCGLRSQPQPLCPASRKSVLEVAQRACEVYPELADAVVTATASGMVTACADGMQLPVADLRMDTYAHLHEDAEHFACRAADVVRLAKDPGKLQADPLAKATMKTKIKIDKVP